MTSIAYSPVSIQACAHSVPSLPCWFGEMTLMAHYSLDVYKVSSSTTSLRNSWVNGGVLALMDWLQVSNVASQMRHLCAHPQDALQLLFCKLLR
jgi:hypothetical protein